MTTLADAIKDALDSNWAGSGGAEPALYNTEDVGQGWPPDNDWIMLLGWTYEERTRRRNDAFVYKVYRISLRAHSKNDTNGEERLDTIVTEIYRIITPTNVTGYHNVDIVDQHRRASDKRYNRYIADLTVECLIKSTAAAATPGSGGTGDVAFPADVSIAGDLTMTGNIGLSGTAPSATYQLYRNAAGSCYQWFESDDAASSIMLQAHTGFDASLFLRESTNNRGVVFYDASTNKVRFYSYGANAEVNLSDGGEVSFINATDGTVTLTQINDLLMFGSANAAWIPCALEGWNPTAGGVVTNIGEISNVDNTNIFITFMCPLPPARRGLKLYVSGTKIHMNAGNGTNYVVNTYTETLAAGTGKTAIDVDATAKNAVQVWPDTFTAVDCSAASAVRIRLQTIVANAGALKINNVEMQCYYAA